MFLGFDEAESGNLQAIKDYINFIDKQFMLVMISDYFDESLILLRRLMNWSMAGKSTPSSRVLILVGEKQLPSN